MALALGVHGAAFAASERRALPASPNILPLEVELAPAPEPAPSEMPEPEEEPLRAEPIAPVQAKAAPRLVATAAPAIAAAAKVGALLTSGETMDSSEPVAFLSDPNGGTYGSGVVAHGGTADHGTGRVITAEAPPSLPSRPSGDEVTPAANLSRPPSLEEADACRGFFPREAVVDVGKVDLIDIVQPSGRVKTVNIARETPAGEGFGAAARTCLLAKRFAPAMDRAGRAVTAQTAVRVHFTR
jgi:hypothetical protein